MNEEIAKEEDETSESDDNETDTSEDEDLELKIESRTELVVKQEDFMLNEQVNFDTDVYSYTICANMTKCCSPLQQGFALK